MLKVLFAGHPDSWERYAPALRAACDARGVAVDLALDHAPDEVTYLIYSPSGPVSDFSPFVNTRAVLNLWAGVERVVQNPTLTQPLTRMVDSGLTEGMREWVCGHVLRHHLGMDRHIVNPDQIWDDTPPPLARNRRVVVLGLGALGQACATALAQLGFDVAGWSQSAKDLPGVACFAGPDQLDQALSGAQAVVLLLPATPQTENVLDARRLALLAPSATVINPGRGTLIDDDALLAALDSGQVGAATLDVFRVEPLPSDHPYWQHPRVTVTPHVASTTRASTSAEVIAENIWRDQQGLPLLHLVDRVKGY